jgi:ElaB/YqjD/DUF883 family membrane-anchored ribosome-binding protein
MAEKTKSGATSDDGFAAFQSDIEDLRRNLEHVMQQVTEILGDGSGSSNGQRSRLGGLDGDVSAMRNEASDAVREVAAIASEALDKSLKAHPYATLGIAFVLGLLLGTRSRR